MCGYRIRIGEEAKASASKGLRHIGRNEKPQRFITAACFEEVSFTRGGEKGACEKRELREKGRGKIGTTAGLSELERAEPEECRRLETAEKDRRRSLRRILRAITRAR